MLKSAPDVFVFNDFSFGLDWSSKNVSPDKRFLSEAKNVNITPYAGIQKRKGITKLHSSAAGTDPIMSIYEYRAPDGINYLLVSIGDKVRAWYNSQWNDVKTNMASRAKYSFVTFQGYCYGVNGINNNFKILNTTVSSLGIEAPDFVPGVTLAGSSGITGSYKYIYAYKRSADTGMTNELISNYSPISSAVNPSDQEVHVSVQTSDNSEVDKIIIYRTLDLLDEANPGTSFYKVTELDNDDAEYTDTNSDNDLTTLATNTNGVPPKAKFLTVHKNRVFYANCPGEDSGGSLVKWSKTGQAEAVPSTYYQYFDSDDGEEITGIASAGDYVIVFKKNKTSVLSGDFQELYVFSKNLGCIAPYSIIEMEDKVVFLSEAGWKAFDGTNLYDLSSRIVDKLYKDGYIQYNHAIQYSGIYYQERRQLQFLLYHPSITPRVMVGHFIMPLLFIDKGIPEQKSENIVGWTYHQYDNHTFSCLGTYTNNFGVTKIVAGNNNGYVYELDYGRDDDGSAIAYEFKTGWSSLETPISMSKTARLANLAYYTDLDYSFSFNTDLDYSDDYDTSTVSDSTGVSYCGYSYCGYAYCGGETINQENIKLKGTGRLFRFGISASDSTPIELSSITIHLRNQGVR